MLFLCFSCEITRSFDTVEGSSFSAQKLYIAKSLTKYICNYHYPSTLTKDRVICQHNGYNMLYLVFWLLSELVLAILRQYRRITRFYNITVIHKLKNGCLLAAPSGTNLHDPSTLMAENTKYIFIVIIKNRIYLAIDFTFLRYWWRIATETRSFGNVVGNVILRRWWRKSLNISL